MRRRFGWVALVGVAAMGVLAPVTHAANDDKPTAYPGGKWSPEPATYGVVAEKNVPVYMSDGAKLTVDVYYPGTMDNAAKVPGDYPVLLTQTPYTGSIGAAELASNTGPGAYFVQRGYIYVSADVRGTGRSGGSGAFFGPRDAKDGVDLIRWILDDLLKDKADDKKLVGLHGCSYLGHTQVYTAAALADAPDAAYLERHVKAMIPMCVSSDPYRDTYMENGIPAPAWEGAGLAAGTLLGPTIEASMVPQYVNSQQDSPHSNAYDNEFWEDRDHIHVAPKIVSTGIPALLWNGWNDSGFGGLELYSALQNAAFGRDWGAPLGPHDQVTGDYQLILGDWGHGGGLDEGIQLEWYDTWLKGENTGMPTNTNSPVHVQDRVTHEWRNIRAYPFVTGTQTLSLGSEGAADPTITFGPSEAQGTTVTYDLGDVTGQVLAGPSALHVTASTTAKDAMLRAELYDVAGGTSKLVTWGAVLGSMRTLRESRSWKSDDGRWIRPFLDLTASTDVPSGPVDYDIPLDPTLWTFTSSDNASHHLQLRLMSLPDQQLCQQKQAAITTSAVGCRPRSGVLANLVGGQYTISLGATYLNVPLVSPSDLPGTVPAVHVEGDRPVDLPTEW